MSQFDSLVEEIKKDLDGYKDRGLKVFASSSLQTNSMPLLHIISRVAPDVPVYFLNTGYHFPETLSFRKQVQDLLGLNITDLYSAVPRNQQKDAAGRLLFTSDPDYCCYLNKIQPLEPILASNDVWISGVRGDQSKVRAAMKREEKAPNGVIRFHPMLNWTSKMVYDYIREFKLPKHPLESEGYLSIGCEPCTRKIDVNALLDDRSGRWAGMNKTECGLHTQLIQK
ncbi:phosphoadenylyl-sulfate reductase [Adhaeribacter aquaticus]|uniref:phosphoadenylyl-sulfate reductase n=1 Tax=Adhaeribacter aquaticus TaxID=299567 RepID=UPI0003F8647A|nr:phosphoadenylyl-sulfate reductase [Adhaeribacter aquaticus]